MKTGVVTAARHGLCFAWITAHGRLRLSTSAEVTATAGRSLLFLQYARPLTQRSDWQDGSAAAGVHLDMYQINCNLDMNVVRHSRYKLLIEKCHQFDPAKLAQVSGGLPSSDPGQR